MVYLTGDIHGPLSVAKFSSRAWPEGKELTRDDYVIILGDFGLVWDDSMECRYWLKWLESKPWTTLFIDGNHENHDALDAMDAEERFGGKVHVIPGHPHVIHLMRGYVFDLPLSKTEVVSALAMGGARSTDRMSRIEGFDWWAREMPSEEEYDRCTASLQARDWRVDYVLTHELPADLRMHALDWRSFAELSSGADRLSSYLQWTYDNLNKGALRRWYAGHYHVDKFVDGKVRVLFEDVVPIDEASERD